MTMLPDAYSSSLNGDRMLGTLVDSSGQSTAQTDSIIVIDSLQDLNGLSLAQWATSFDAEGDSIIALSDADSAYSMDSAGVHQGFSRQLVSSRHLALVSVTTGASAPVSGREWLFHWPEALKQVCDSIAIRCHSIGITPPFHLNRVLSVAEQSWRQSLARVRTRENPGVAIGITGEAFVVFRDIRIRCTVPVQAIAQDASNSLAIENALFITIVPSLPFRDVKYSIEELRSRNSTQHVAGPYSVGPAFYPARKPFIIKVPYARFRRSGIHKIIVRAYDDNRDERTMAFWYWHG